jgi:hypothetical protein
MDDPNSNPVFEARRLKSACGWYVRVAWPNGKRDHIPGFVSQHEALCWIEGKAPAWLSERSNAHPVSFWPSRNRFLARPARSIIGTGYGQLGRASSARDGGVSRARHRIGTLASHAAGHRRYCEWSLSNSCLRASFPALLAAAIVVK